MKTITIITGIVLLCSTAMARIGETPEQCDKRYGAPTIVATNMGALYHVYRVKEFVVYSYFLSNSCHMIMYAKPDKWGINDEISYNDILYILDSNSTDGIFIEVDVMKMAFKINQPSKRQQFMKQAIEGPTWLSMNNRIQATYLRDSSSLILMSNLWMDYYATHKDNGISVL